jgi:hypothetical protein
MNKSFPMHLSPRRLATSKRTGKPCGAPALVNANSNGPCVALFPMARVELLIFGWTSA